MGSRCKNIAERQEEILLNHLLQECAKTLARDAKTLLKYKEIYFLGHLLLQECAKTLARDAKTLLKEKIHFLGHLLQECAKTLRQRCKNIAERDTVTGHLLQ